MKQIYSLLLLIFLPFVAYAQGPAEGQGRKAQERMAFFQKDRINFIKSKVTLTDTEAAVLFDMLKENDNKKFRIWAQMRELHTAIKNMNEPSDEVYNQTLDKLFGLEREQAMLEEEVGKKIREAYSPKKAYEVFSALKRFYASHIHKPNNKDKASRQ